MTSEGKQDHPPTTYREAGFGQTVKRFDFLEFLLSDGTSTDLTAQQTKVTSRLASLSQNSSPFPEFRDGYYGDGYEHLSGYSDLHSPPRNPLKNTVYAVCIMKAAGLKPLKEDLEYLKKNSVGIHSFVSRQAPLVFALGIDERTVRFMEKSRQKDGGYDTNGDRKSTLEDTRSALTILRMAGRQLNKKEKEETEAFIASRLEDEKGYRMGYRRPSLETCYDALVSLNLLGSEIAPKVRELVTEEVNSNLVEHGAQCHFERTVTRIILHGTTIPVVEKKTLSYRALEGDLEEIAYTALRNKLDKYIHTTDLGSDAQKDSAQQHF